MAQDFIAVRVSPEMSSAIAEISEALGITKSEWIRGLVAQALEGRSILDVDEGYLMARRLATQLAMRLIVKARETLPASYEDAVRAGLLKR